MLYGSTNSWRNNDFLDNVCSWGIGVDYVIAKNVQFSAMQSIASRAKSGNVDPNEETRAEVKFCF
ncbi:hypothetical protein NXG27_12145 [Megasphaera paucivorans]|uniref:hypothetical protein n=1 Tax=Megasphaera paucivorans TaxID=349095 RepID=UPI00115FA21D|nr:hypothetical protein [Megasphaera paucivorans]